MAILLSMLSVDYFFRPLHPNQTAPSNPQYFVVFILFAAVRAGWRLRCNTFASSSLRACRSEWSARLREALSQLM
jgi:hypothetical protein